MTTNPFRNSTNTRLLKGLFFETTNSENKSTVLYTLKDSDHLGYLSLYRLYMDEEDQTEYVFANTYLDGYEHWEMLCACSWFKPYVQRWRKELELKLKARYLAQIKASAEGDSPQAITNAKYLLEKGWEKGVSSSTNKRGRPSKDEINAEANRIALETSRVKDDYNRLKDLN